MWDLWPTLLVGSAIIAAALFIGYLVRQQRLRSPAYLAKVANAKRDRWADIERRREDHQQRKAARADRFVGDDPGRGFGA